MATSYTSLLGLALPVTGELSGTWGDTVNDQITALLDSSIAGTTTITSDADVTLTTTTGAANTSRQAILLWTASGTVTRTITAPAQSKTYVVINKTGSTQSIKLVGVGPTTGVTIIAGESAVCAWNGVDFIKTGSTIANAAGSNTQVQFNNSGVLGGSANLTWSGTALAVTGTVAVTGDLGIGTASPAAKFQTNSTDGTIAIFRTTSGANNGRLNIDISDSAATAGFAVGGNSSFPAMTFANGGAERMRIDSSGNVGIGTSSSSSPLNVVSASSSLAIAINGRSSDSLGAMYFYANDGTTQYSTITASATEFRLSSVPAAAVQTFHTNGSERMRLDASGNLGIGTTAPTAQLHSLTTSGTTTTLGRFEAAVGSYTGTSLIAANTLGASSTYNLFSCITDSDGDAGGPVTEFLVRGDGNVGIGTASPSSVLNVKSGAPVFRLETTGTVSSTGTASYAIRDSTGADVFSYGYLGLANCFQFSTIPAAGFMRFLTGAQVEAMRIDSSGNVLVGQASGNADARVSIDAGSTDSSPVIDFRKGSATTTTAQVYARFFCNGGAVATGSITANGVSAATFTGYSDRRLKENIVDLPSQLSNIMALRPVEFDFKGYENGEGHQIGFIAQEVQEIYPDSVGEGADGMLTLSDMNKNDARLIKAIQEMKTIMDAQASTITALTARITALENK
jgi:hypothetical protein